MSSLSVCGGGAKFVEYSYDARTGQILAYVASEVCCNSITLCQCVVGVQV